MKPEIVLTYEFVEFIPDELKEQTLYISVTYCTAVHKCCCGCGREVVTPLSPTAWQLTFNGKTVSLYPSIGSWSLPCQSHYFITKNKVVWARKWTKKQIARGRAQEARGKEKYYATTQLPTGAAEAPCASLPTNTKPKETLWQKIKDWFS
ncbi:MAG TPA: DUF6527 family protein [Terriglobia bacterium]|nr:DUF6527 family protein [Terriglobia bacterium]